MKKFRIILIAVCAMLATVFAFAGCGETEAPPAQKPEYGTVQGTVKDADGEPISGAEIYWSEDDSVESDDDGKYEIKHIKIGDITLNALCSGYSELTKTLTEADFDDVGEAVCNFVLEEGKGTIQGIVSMDGNPTAKLEGVTVKIGTKFTATTNAKGEYTLENVPMLDRQQVVASCTGYEESRKTVTPNSYSDGVAKLNFSLVQEDCAELPGIKPYQLETLEPLEDGKLTYTANEISARFNSSPDGAGGSSAKVEAHGEGYCVNANTGNANSNMVAFVFAKLHVNEQHKYLTAYARIFYGQNGGDTRGDDGSWNRGSATVAKLGLAAFELKEEGYEFIDDARFGAYTEVTTESFTPITFDLTAMMDKDIVFVLGTKTGYHCCLDRVEFSAVEPQYLNVTGVKGIDSLRKYNKVTADSFDGNALKDQWAVGGGVGKVTEGIQLNGADPWKAVDFDANNPQPVNSYMYITTDITAEKPHLTVNATIVNLNDTIDPAQENRRFLPYFCVIVLDATGNNVYQSAWTKLEVENNGDNVTFDYDLTACVGTDMTVIIAANVGYRATITNVTFNAAAPEGANVVQPALLPSKQED